MIKLKLNFSTFIITIYYLSKHTTNVKSIVNSSLTIDESSVNISTKKKRTSSHGSVSLITFAII